MSLPPNPTPPPSEPAEPGAPAADLVRLQAWRELQHQLEHLHAQLQYVKLLIRLGVHAP